MEIQYRSFDPDIEIEKDDFKLKPKAIRNIKNKKPTPELVSEKQKMIEKFIKTSENFSKMIKKKVKNCDPDELFDTEGDDYAFEVVTEIKYFQGLLRGYQMKGVTWLNCLFRRSINGILGDEMGLGKTIQVIALFAYLYEHQVPGPYLIVVPLSTLSNWMAEFARFAPKLPVVRMQGLKNDQESEERAAKATYVLDGRKVQPIVVCSYQTPTNMENFFRRFRWQYVVVDEGHRLKNPKSILSMVLNGLAARNRLLLTGTPLENNLLELFGLLHFLLPDLFDNLHIFADMLLPKDLKNKDDIIQKEAENKIIQTIHQILAPLMLRREKKFVLTELVPKKEVVVCCPLADMQRMIYRAILNEDFDYLFMENSYKEEIVIETNLSGRKKRKCTYNINFEEKIDSFFVEPDTLPISQNVRKNIYKLNPNCPYKIQLKMQSPLMSLRRAVDHPYLIWAPVDPAKKFREMLIDENLISNSGKMIVLDQMLKKLKADGHRVLIFSYFKGTLDLISYHMEMRGYTYERLDGDSSAYDRDASIANFRDNDIFVFLLTTRAGGLGLNLTNADTVIFIDRDWNPMIDIQAMARCHRIGQSKPVMVFSLLAQNTVDEYITEVGERKKRLEKLVIKEGHFMSGATKESDLKDLKKLLDNEIELVRIQANGRVYTDAEMTAILDRSELLKQAKELSQLTK